MKAEKTQSKIDNTKAQMRRGVLELKTKSFQSNCKGRYLISFINTP